MNKLVESLCGRLSGSVNQAKERYSSEVKIPPAHSLNRIDTTVSHLLDQRLTVDNFNRLTDLLLQANGYNHQTSKSFSQDTAEVQQHDSNTRFWLSLVKGLKKGEVDQAQIKEVSKCGVV